jgi:cytochrome c556
MRRATLALPTIVAVVLAGPVAAHEHATGVVKERMDAMSDMAKHQKAISQRLQNKRDLTAIKADAEAIAAHAPHITHLFPAGSTQKPTQARPAVWQNWSDFENKAKALETASRALAETSASDVQALTAAATALTRTCADCHEKYRARK